MKPNFSLKYNGEIINSSKEITELANGVTVTKITKEYQEYDALEWVLFFKNSSETNSGMISEILDCDTMLPLSFPENKKPGYKPECDDACIITMNGMIDSHYYWENDPASAIEYGFNYEYLDKTPEKTKSFANVGGRSSDGMMPFFDVTASGNGYIVAIGWTGSWRAEFAKCEEGIKIRTGLAKTDFYLKSGEEIRTSSILIMKYHSKEDKHNKFRNLIKNYFSHKSCTFADRDGLLAYELWGGLTSAEMKKRINELKQHDIKFEDVWIDAGWYGNCEKCDETFSGDWWAHTGEWIVNPRVHPNGLQDVSDCAKEAGMKLMLWFEPERAIEGTELIKEHPEWFLTLPDTKSQLLNYGNQDALEYVCRMIEEFVNRLDLSCYRQDFNTKLDAFCKANDEEDRQGITEIKHIMGMYRVWDYILEKFPQIIIDNCASGGRRIDIETLKRSIPFFRSDYQCNFNENPEVLQAHNSNISCYLPYNGCTSKRKNDTYAIRSSYSSSWGGAFYNAIFQTMDEKDFVWVKKITDEYRKIRRYMSMDFYNHGSVVFDSTSWTIWQYNDPKTQSGIVMAFRRSGSPFDTVGITLKGVSNGEYIYENIDTDEKYIGESKLTITLAEKRMSTIICYQRKEETE